MKSQPQRHAALAGERGQLRREVGSLADGRQSWENKQELTYSISSSIICGGQEKAEATDGDRQTNPLIWKDTEKLNGANPSLRCSAKRLAE